MTVNRLMPALLDGMWQTWARRFGVGIGLT